MTILENNIIETEIVNPRPITPSMRGMTKVVTRNLHKGNPCSQLTVAKKKNHGRNNYGRITCRHKGGGHKQLYRIIDWKRDKYDIIGRVESVEYDPNRSANIALLCYMDGERRYIIAPNQLHIGMQVVSSANAPIKVGNTLPLHKIPVGTVVHCVELYPKGGAQIARSAGSSVQVLGRDGIYAQLRLRSGEIRKVLLSCLATIGEVGNTDHNLRKFGKAGVKRWLGIRPTVRGVAMNPIDHPHGGGEGKTAAGRHPVSPWGQKTKGFKTRSPSRDKLTKRLIIRRRKSKR